MSRIRKPTKHGPLQTSVIAQTRRNPLNYALSVLCRMPYIHLHILALFFWAISLLTSCFLDLGPSLIALLPLCDPLHGLSSPQSTRFRGLPGPVQ